MKITFSIEIGSSGQCEKKGLLARAFPYIATGVSAFLRSRGDHKGANTVDALLRGFLHGISSDEDASHNDIAH
jgi:hypothetical protein